MDVVNDNIKVRMVNGYRVIYLPDHLRAMKSKNWNGWVYEHIVIAEKKLGRPINSKIEQVHHDDENRVNNSEDNILIKPIGEHTKEHNSRRNREKLWDKLKKLDKLKHICKVCSKIILNRNEFCSQKCINEDRKRQNRPPKDELEALIELYSTYELATMYNVMSKTIRRWKKDYCLGR